MPKIFSDEDREALRERLFDEGRRLFERFGLKKTTVEDLARAVGIAKGTFYNFFQSKELLFMELLERKEEALKAAILKTAAEEPDARRTFLAVMELTLDYARRDTLMRHLRESGDMAILLRAVRGAGAEKFERNFAIDVDAAKAFLDLLRAKGASIDIDPRVFAGLSRGIAIMALHENDIGPDVAPHAMKLLLSYIADGLFGKKKPG